MVCTNSIFYERWPEVFRKDLTSALRIDVCWGSQGLAGHVWYDRCPGRMYGVQHTTCWWLNLFQFVLNAEYLSAALVSFVRGTSSFIRPAQEVVLYAFTCISSVLMPWSLDVPSYREERTATQYAETNTLRIPEVFMVGDYKGGSFLVTEYLNFGGRADQAELGKALAEMHLATPAVRSTVLATPAFGVFQRCDARKIASMAVQYRYM